MKRNVTMGLMGIFLLFVVLFAMKEDRQGHHVNTREEMKQTIGAENHSLTISMPSVAQPLVRLQARSTTNGVVEIQTEKRNNVGFLRVLLSMFLAALFTALFGGVKSSWRSILLNYLGFTGYHISQIKIIHQRDGKKRTIAI
ncbi:MAG: hypothetical protein RSD28_04340 [Lachnospiraceae bacterium]